MGLRINLIARYNKGLAEEEEWEALAKQQQAEQIQASREAAARRTAGTDASIGALNNAAAAPLLATLHLQAV